MAKHQEGVRAVLYTRVSTDEQAENGTSLTGQYEACRAKAVQIGAEVVAHYEDAGVSGTRYDSRPGMQSALTAIENGTANILIVANLTRFSRDREHQSTIKKRVERTGARLVFCDMDFADTPEGDLAFGIMGSFADYERKVIRERTVRGKWQRAKEGIQPARTRSPFGYHVVTSEDVLAGHYPLGTVGTYQVVEEQAQWVRQMFAWYANGESLRKVARRLQDAGVLTPRGAAYWRQTTVRQIIENPVHKGAPAFGRTRRRTDEARLKQGFKRIDFNVDAPEEEWITLSAPAIVSEAEWEQCQRNLKGNQATRGGNPSRRYLLTGYVFCPCCGRRMRGVKMSRGGYTYYRCPYNTASQTAIGEAGICSGKHYRTEKVESDLARAFGAVADEPHILSDAISAFQNRGSEDTKEYDSLTAELTSVNTRERATVQAQIAGVQAGADPALYAAVFADIRNRKAEIEAKLAKIVQPAPTIQIRDRQQVEREVRERVGRVGEVLTDPEVAEEEKRNLLACVVKSVCPSEEGCQVSLRNFEVKVAETVALMLVYCSA